MPGTGASTEALLLIEARAVLAHSTAGDVLAMRMGAEPSPRLIASMRVGASITVGAVDVLRSHREVWEFATPSGCLVVSRGVEGSDYGTDGWRVVEVDRDGGCVTLDETKGLPAALSVALSWATNNPEELS